MSAYSALVFLPPPGPTHTSLPKRVCYAVEGVYNKLVAQLAKDRAELKSLTQLHHRARNEGNTTSKQRRRRRLDWHRRKPYQRPTCVDAVRATEVRKAMRAANQRKKQIEVDAEGDEWKLCDACDKYDKFWEDHGGAVTCEDCLDRMMDDEDDM